MKQNENYKNAKKSSKSAKTVLITSAIIYVLVLLCIVGYIISDVNSKGNMSGGKKIVIMNGTKKVQTITSKNMEPSDGGVYISSEILQKYTGAGIAGDSKLVSVVFGGSGKDSVSADFKCGTDNAEVCGTKIFLDSPSVYSDGKLYIPLSFVQKYISGLTFEESKDSSKVLIDISSGNFGFTIPGNDPELRIPVTKFFDVSASSASVSFKTDLSKYEQYMNPSDKDKYLFLVNYENYLSKDYLPENLTDLINTRKDGRSTQQMEHTAAMAMEAMFKEAEANGYTKISITSAYRSYNYQQKLFDNQVNSLKSTYGDKAEEMAAQAVAIPGTSEHQTGLCADLHSLSSASQAFADTEEYQWLISNCAKFGFILRFPKNKTEYTHIMFEPWHYRFVGRYHATRIMELGLSLEEYVEQYNSQND